MVTPFFDLAAVASFCASISADGLRIGVYVNNMPGDEAHIGVLRESPPNNAWASHYSDLEKVPMIAPYLSSSGFICATGIVNLNQGETVTFSEATRVFQIRHPGWQAASSVGGDVPVPDGWTSSWTEVKTAVYARGQQTTFDSYSAMFVFFPECSDGSCAV